jgi:hypothetical protein
MITEKKVHNKKEAPAASGATGAFYFSIIPAKGVFTGMR